MRVSIIVFPGSNCDRDVAVCIRAILGKPAMMVWHGESTLPKSDAIILPGGFSYGDYLRGGAIAAHSPIMREVVARAEKGVPILGICNGFQILTECGLLRGALIRNRGLNFVCRNTALVAHRTDTPFTSAYKKGARVTIPVAHNEGNYTADDDTLKRLADENCIAFTYAAGDNPNGAMRDIAGITNRAGNVLGMMPHPERSAEPALGGTDGRGVFESLARL